MVQILTGLCVLLTCLVYNTGIPDTPNDPSAIPVLLAFWMIAAGLDKITKDRE